MKKIILFASVIIFPLVFSFAQLKPPIFWKFPLIIHENIPVTLCQGSMLATITESACACPAINVRIQGFPIANNVYGYCGMDTKSSAKNINYAIGIVLEAGLIYILVRNLRSKQDKKN